MKIRFGIAVAGLSGSAGDTTAATWKGIGYFRTRVVPANPQTAGQIAQREAFARSLKCWQHLNDDIKTFLNVLGADRQLAGCNISMKTAVATERATGFGPPIPTNKYLRNIEGFAAVQGGAGRGINVSWTATDWEATDRTRFYLRERTEPGVFATPWVITPNAVGEPMDAGAFIITAPVGSTFYALCMSAFDTDGNFAGAVLTEVQSGVP